MARVPRIPVPNFETVLKRTERNIADKFASAIQSIKDAADRQDLEEAIARRDTAGVLRILNMSQAYFYELDRAIDQAYYDGATREGKLIQNEAGPALVVRFDGRHRRAETFVRETGAALVVQVTRDTQEGIRQIVEAGLAAGRHPRDVAQDIIGRIPKGGTHRVGGIVGLHSTFARYVDNARAELQRADPAYFERKARNRSADAMLRKLFEAGKAPNAQQINKIVAQYADNLLKLRGETIARTEAIKALNAGRYEMARQLVESGDVPHTAITFIWDATLSKRTRDSHLALNGTETGFDEPFKSPLTGALLRYPGDTGMGAPGSETINCRCTMRTRIDRRALATKKPVGRPTGAKSKPPAIPLPQPPVPPPVAPPVFPQATLPAPVPTLPVPPRRTPESFTSFFEWRDYAKASGIAETVQWRVMLNPDRVREMGRMILTAQDVTERFSLPALSEFRCENDTKKERENNAGGWMNLHGMRPPWNQKPYIVIKSNMTDPEATDRSFNWQSEFADATTPIVAPIIKKWAVEAAQFNLAKREEYEQIAAVIDETFRAERTAMRSRKGMALVDTITVHEYGHYFHGVYWDEVTDALSKFDWSIWSNVISEYSKQNEYEVVAEAFTIYVLGDENDYRRIPPPLLALFREKDNRHGTGA